MTPASLAKRWLSPRALVLARCVTRGLPVPRWGNMRRVRPFSNYHGFDRGTPVDRYYLDKFLQAHRGDIRGDVLEIQVSSYTQKHGRDIRRADTVDLAPQFRATYTCDLAESEGIIPSDAYDCFLLPNTLTNLRNVCGCLQQALRIVRPGGTILATGIVLGQMDREAVDYWRMSSAGWREVAARAWVGAEVSVTTYGNCLAATAAIQGLAMEELSAAELDVEDRQFPVLVGLHCRKGNGARHAPVGAG